MEFDDDDDGGLSVGLFVSVFVFVGNIRQKKGQLWLIPTRGLNKDY